MRSANIVDSCSDNALGEVDVKAVKLELVLARGSMQQKEYHKANLPQHQKSNTNPRRQESEENRSSKFSSTRQSNSSSLDHQLSPIDDANISSASPICAAPVCRQFWKAGNYDEGLASKSTTIQNGSSYLHIHPKFLHSNATSHKWAFGAVAELLDNAVDEIQNGATFVIVDKTSNPRDGNPALLIQDDGGGMDPEAMRRCLSFGFSDKKSKSAIGQYGNGFKTSSMRLGADVIVFSRHFKKRKLTQSIGLLSYTFLSQTGHDRIVVPMVDYEFNASAGTMEAVDRYNKEHFTSNLSVLLQWSPYSTEVKLLKQFDDIGYHGTKIIVYNLWLNDEGTMELDFDSDPEDICIRRDVNPAGKNIVSEQHLANRLRYSLRVYLSVLYLRIPESFCMILRGRVVEYHNIATDLKFPEFILYKPHSGGCAEGSVITTIGFVKEAPRVNIHGFNVYHKNRLILPFWHVVSYCDSRGRGVVGVLEANFIQPTHNKQDFEKTSVFQKLETRLKEMTREYWDYHCGLIGYHQVRKKIVAPTASPLSPDGRPQAGVHEPVVLNNRSFAADTNIERRFGKAFANIQRSAQQGEQLKRKEQHHLAEPENTKRRAGGVILIDIEPNKEIQSSPTKAKPLQEQEAITLLQENKRLQEQCLEYEKEQEELNLKVMTLKREIEDTKRECARMMAELEWLDNVKDENKVR